MFPLFGIKTSHEQYITSTYLKNVPPKEPSLSTSSGVMFGLKQCPNSPSNNNVPYTSRPGGSAM